jgi:AraC-like DNA-binding protein
MSYQPPALEVHVERGRSALRVVARSVAPAPALLLEATFCGQADGVWFRLTQQGASRLFSRDEVARHPALSGVLRLLADELDLVRPATAKGVATAASQELLGFLCRSLLVYVQRMGTAVPLPHSVTGGGVTGGGVTGGGVTGGGVAGGGVAGGGVAGGERRPLRDARVERALELLNMDITRRWTVELLARAVGVSRPVFARQFLRVLGLSPMRYLTQRRLQIAASLLLGSDAALAEVAARVGYSSEFAFSRAFRKQYQVPPGVYRQRPPNVVALASVCRIAA